jgi:hypothetical protein
LVQGVDRAAGIGVMGRWALEKKLVDRHFAGEFMSTGHAKYSFEIGAASKAIVTTADDYSVIMSGHVFITSDFDLTYFC